MARTIDTDWLCVPVCPWCGAVIRDKHLLRLSHDAPTSTSCAKCGRPYDIYTHVSINHTTRRPGDDAYGGAPGYEVIDDG